MLFHYRESRLSPGAVDTPLSGPCGKLHIRIGRWEPASVAPAMFAPDVVPPIGERPSERLLARVVLVVPIDGNPVPMQREQQDFWLFSERLLNNSGRRGLEWGSLRSGQASQPCGKRSQLVAQSRVVRGPV